MQTKRFYLSETLIFDNRYIYTRYEKHEKRFDSIWFDESWDLMCWMLLESGKFKIEQEKEKRFEQKEKMIF